jgi:hypothetical protein
MVLENERNKELTMGRKIKVERRRPAEVRSN